LVQGSNPALAYVWPAVLLLIGILFLTHPQHGTGEAVAKAVRQHRILGITAIIAGLLRVAGVVSGSTISAILWSLALLVSAAQLILYREPEGAFEPAGSHGRHGEPG
jgi:low temperature requirement protein LtrA